MPKSHSQIKSECKRMLGKSFKNHSFFSSAEAKTEIQKRSQLWKRLEPNCSFIKNNNKIHYGELSPGCQLCAAGKWTCLFIAGKCPNGCFFCPVPQDKDRLPNADGIGFDNVAQFISYLKKVGTTGVSFSGGEPLLYLDLVEEYCTAVRKEFSSAMYIWCYTSGLGVTKRSLELLKQAGIDELRFNIAAFDYDLSKVSLAKEYIPRVTVEIPAVPEDFKILQKLIKELALIGVDHLNLHEMALSSFNEKEMGLRGYKLNRLENGSTIHESGMAILKLMNFAAKNNIKMPINSCTYLYKERITLSAKNIIAAKFLQLTNSEEMTNSGLIRTIGMIISKREMHLIEKMNISKDYLFDINDGVLFATPQTILDILDSLDTLDTKRANLAVIYDVAVAVRAKGKKNKITADRIQYTEMIELTVEDLRKIADKKHDQIKNINILDLESIPDGLADLVI